jgi:hypothetical protein
MMNRLRPDRSLTPVPPLPEGEGYGKSRREIHSKAAKWLLALAAVAVLPYLSVCAYLWSTQRQHIFEPEPLLQTTPARNGMRYEDVRFPSGKGELHGWWIPIKFVQPQNRF